MTQAAFEHAARAIAEADFVLIGAGAGMSAAAGVDYTDEESFARIFPAFLNRGLRARYQAIGYKRWPPAVHWAYWATHVDDIRFGPRNDAVYHDLLALVGSKDYFVYTSNVDMLFPRNGFDEQRLFTPQGDYGYLQCVRACQPVVYESRAVIRRLMQCIDPATQTVSDPDAIPHCPNCGGDMFLNVRLDGFFIDTPYHDQRQRMMSWLAGARGKRLVVIEIGAGFNTPAVIRWPCEQFAAQTGATLVRINRDHPELPDNLKASSVSFRGNADAVLRRLAVAEP